MNLLELFLRRGCAWSGALLFVFMGLFTALPTYAHEAYVLTQEQFQAGTEEVSVTAFEALEDPENLRLSIIIGLSILAVIIAHFFFRETRFGHRVEHQFERFSTIGHFALRAAIAATLFYSAYTGSFLGPEVSLEALPYAGVVQGVLFVISFMVFVGLFTELAALVGLVVYTVAFLEYGLYMVTYFSYLGEMLALLLFGLRRFSFDRLIFGRLDRFEGWEKYRPAMIRVFYGIALVFAAVNIKFLHSDLSLAIVNEYNLTQFGFLFPSDPLLVVLGAGLAELAIGIFIIIGFELRLTIITSLVFITLSQIFFRESVWPHLILYGVSFYLLFSPETFTVDNLLFGKRKFFFDHRKQVKGEVVEGGIAKKGLQ